MPVSIKNTALEQQAAIVTFRLGSQVYAFPIAPVRQIIDMVTITPIPHTSQAVVGVINFHGSLAPVVNLRHRLGMEEAPVELHTPIILVIHSERVIGFIVDQVLNVVELPADQIIEPNRTLLKELGGTSLLQGLVFSGRETILLLDLEHLLSADYAQVVMETAGLSASNEVRGAGTVDDGPPAGEPFPLIEDLAPILENEPEAQPEITAKARRRKKSGNSKPVASEA